ncbi:hypothetical protein F66182_3255 [Fusarium sp. NRRL 66182]|nr:hypothetical protein F66182_3255 [Fusarium sp. NRRL 66182]
MCQERAGVYITTLQRRLASLEGKADQPTEDVAGQSRSSELSSTLAEDGGDGLDRQPKTSTPKPPCDQAETQGHDSSSEAKTPLTNPLAFHTYDFFPGPKGWPRESLLSSTPLPLELENNLLLVFMGTLSNWSFNKRVLTMTHERLMGTPLPNSNLHYTGLDGKVYDLQWDGTRKPSSQDTPDLPPLPNRDFALHLIDAVRFHCDWLYNLFDERFTDHFHHFHERPEKHTGAESLWFVHYLLVLALGKAFVVQTTKSRRPPGGELFLQAMKLMPDFSFFECDIIDQMQVLCCAALYLQCVDRVQQAYPLLCTALRQGVEHGMHTEMQSNALEEAYVQRCRSTFWTIYILERQMVSQMGLPVCLSDEKISTPFPALPGQPQRLEALKIHVDFCRVRLWTRGQIGQSIPGGHAIDTQKHRNRDRAAEQFIRDSSERGNGWYLANIGTPASSAAPKCIILTTRPLLYTFLLSRLGHLEVALMHWLQSESVKGLVQMCTESAQQILRILSSLSDQDLLETFLRFDQDATFTATIALLMASAIDSSLLPDHTPWSQRAYAIFDEMSSRGNLVASMVASELKQLEELLKGFLANESMSSVTADDFDDSAASVTGYMGPFNFESAEEFNLGLNYELSAEQLMDIADSLDINSLTWPWPDDGTEGT